ncbi:MAG TPA: TonB-dependent receptor [Bryobacteraceae bacterium]|jgi:hypothetical protein|nr:TonB-dependent receptor [Bryobacteraceae bacterium]
MTLRFSQVFALILLLGVSSSAYAQEVRASIVGTITDPSGAPVSGATVTVTSTATNWSATTQSNETGSYLTPFLTPGKYVLMVEMQGFSRFIRENIVLEVLDRLRVDVTLQLGAVSDSVTVKGEVTTLQTETATRAQTIANELIANVPTQGRNPFQIAWSVPGVVKTGDFRYLRSFDTSGTSGISINGGRNKENEILLDGISNVRSDRTINQVPTMESVAEFKVLTNTYDAQYGRTGGGIVTIVSKSGGNDLHGNLFEYFQNDKMNANQSELNGAGTARPPNHINAFGFQASGPVILPKVYDGRNKLFWLISYEGMRQRSADPGVVSLPLAEWRNGDFSTMRNASGDPVILYDPLTTTADGRRTPFVGNLIPSSRINAVARNVLQYVPMPNTDGANAAHIRNYTYPSRWIGNLDQWIGRMDYQINPQNVVYFRYGQNPYSEYRGLVFATDISSKNPAEPTGNAPLMRNGRTWTANWTSTLSPSIVLDLRAGLSRWEEGTGNTFGANFDPAALGFASSLTAQFNRYQFPRFDFDSFQSIGSSTLANTAAYDTYSLQPNLNFVHGRHFMKFGTEVRRYNDNSANPGKASGSYTFSQVWTQYQASVSSATAGNGLASFLLGYPASAFVDKNIDPAYEHSYYALFFQDDFKVNSRLTLNIGLRWDYESPAVERYDRMLLGFDPNASSPLAASVSGLALKGNLLFANYQGQARGSFYPDKNNIAPRIGAAYRLTDKWVIRGGYGLFYLGQSATGSNTGFSVTTNASTTNDAGLTPAVTLENAFANLDNGRLLTAAGTATNYYGLSLTANYLDRPLPYSHQYSFDIQRELPYNMLFEIGYTGNQTRKLPVSSNLNYVPLDQLGRANSYYTDKFANPMAGLIPNNSALNGSTISRLYTMYAYPQYSQITLANMPIGKARYDALVLKGTKRFSHGLTFIASYVLSKNLEQVSLLNTQDLNPSDVGKSKLEKRPAQEMDTPNAVTFTGVYELPVGRGRHFGHNMSPVLEQFLGGWSFNWEYSFRTGWAVDYPNAPQAQCGSAKLSDPTGAKWLNTDCWTDPTTGRRVSTPSTYTYRTFPSRFSDVRLPSYNNVDFSAAKYFPIHERVRLQFRFEAINAMNHPWFSGLVSTDVTNSGFGMLSTTQRNLPRFLKLALNLSW